MSIRRPTRIIGVALLLTGLVIGLCALARVRQSSAAQVLVAVSSGQSAPAITDVLGAPAANITFNTGLEQLPQSLRGTLPPPGLVIDQQGNLVVTHGLRDFYDYFLSALGEESLPTIQLRTKAYMAKSLPVRANARAIQIFNGYVNYRVALQKLPQAGGKPAEEIDIAAVTAQKEQVASLRSEYLDPDVIAAFFGDEDAFDNYTLGRLKLEHDKSLSAAQKRTQLDPRRSNKLWKLLGSLRTASGGSFFACKNQPVTGS